MQTQDLMKRTTLVEMVSAWEESCAEILKAFETIQAAEDRLKLFFKADRLSSFRTSSFLRYHHQYGELDAESARKMFKQWKKDAWSSLIDRLEVRRILSVARWEQLSKQLETGEGLPEIDVDQIMEMLGGLRDQLKSYKDEAVLEVFEILRPGGTAAQYKTNTQYEIGKRVILGYCVDTRYYPRAGQPRFQIRYGNRRQEVHAIDNVFHLLDSGEIAPNSNGPLIDSIEATTDGKIETAYFKGTCYGNGNLHLEFKRLDLVAKLNAVAGGARLRKATLDSSEEARP